MNYADGKKCLDEILNAVTPEDEKNFFLAIEYIKNYKGTIIGPVHEDGYGNIFDVLLTKNISDIDDLYTWGSFKEAKENLEKKENSPTRCFHLKTGLRIAFEHDMILNESYPYDTQEPKWVSLYNEWADQMIVQKKPFWTEIQELCDVIEKALEK